MKETALSTTKLWKVTCISSWGENMDKGSSGSNDVNSLSYEIITTLDTSAVDITYDDKFVYAACEDLRVRVWSKDDWQLVAELGETDTPPLVVDVDDTQVFATCEKRVYVWNKETWGMTGWFELSYQALTSTLSGDYFYVGAREGRLVSIKKDTHETSSWQLHKSDITDIWSDDKIICTSTNKEEPKVWQKEQDTAPTELAKLDKVGKGGLIIGNPEFVLVGASTGEIAVYDRVDWSLVRTLKSIHSPFAMSSIWANKFYLVAATTSGYLSIWDLKRSEEIGGVALNGQKINWVSADQDRMYVATPEGIIVTRLSISGNPLNVSTDEPHVWTDSLLKTSPYDVLEGALQLEKKGDERYQKGLFHKSVIDYENALQILIDNTHALQEVPEERQFLTEELNLRLGKALLKSKIQEIQALSDEIRQLTEELEVRKRTDRDIKDVEKLWTLAGRTVKESKVLAEAQAGDMLSYQLIHLIETFGTEFSDAMTKYAEFRKTIKQAIALTRKIDNEWHWMERKRTQLPKRKEFLENAMEKLSAALEKAEPEGEVRQIISTAYEEYQSLYGQIDRIVSSYDAEQDSTFATREEAASALESLLVVVPRKIAALKDMANDKEKSLEEKTIISALEQALSTAKTFKLNKMSKTIQAELEKVKTVENVDE
jgi:tetratricopeptide (TPR) repeat protein